MTRAVEDHILGGPAKGMNAKSALPGKGGVENFDTNDGVGYTQRSRAGTNASYDEKFAK